MSSKMQQQLGDIDKEIKFNSRVLSLIPNDHPNLPLLLTRLGDAHEERFDLRGELNDIHKAIEFKSAVVALTPKDDPGLPDLLGSLGSVYDQRFRCLGNMEDLEKGMEYISRAVAMTPDGHPNLPVHLANLALAYNNRFRHLGKLDDIERTIEYASLAVNVATKHYPGLPKLLNNLGESYCARFQRLGELEDLKKAIEYQSQAVESAAEGHPDLPEIIGSLGNSYSYRFERLGELDDIDRAIKYKSRALSLIPDGYPDSSIYLANLGTAYSYRFQRLGKLDDLDQSIQYRFRALASTPDNHPNLMVWLGNLGTSHSIRFKRLGGLDDLEKSIKYRSRALDLAPNNHPHLSTWLTNLEVSYRNRFRRLDNLDDLTIAIDYGSRALSLTPSEHPDLAGQLTNLGTSYSYRFTRLGELDDLEKAIEFKSRALAMTPDDDPSLPGRLTSLGMTLRSRFQHVGQLDDIHKAIEHGSRALALTPDGDPDLSCTYFHQALAYFYYYQYTLDPSHLQITLNFFRAASQSSNGSPQYRFRLAHEWGTLASKHGPLECIEAFQTAIDLLPQFIWLGATTTQRYEDLSTAKTFGIDAALAAISSSKFDIALEWLENARCVVWNQNIMLRSPLDQLQASDPTLAARLRTVASQLFSASSESREFRALSFDLMTEEQVAQEHRRLAIEYDKTLAQARAIPGFEDFLRPMRSNSLACVARTGPIVIINCHKDRCDALMVLPGQSSVSHIPLPNFTQEKAKDARFKLEEFLRQKGLRERGFQVRQKPGGYKPEDEFGNVLRILWSDIVKPILDSLGYLNYISAESLPHITWCPTGAVSFLPLHAAGDYDQPRSRIFDYVISSYTPTVTALLASTPSSLNSSTRVLVIGQEATPNHQPLPGTAKELACMKAHLDNKASCLQLSDSQATTTAVLDAMEQHDWVHLACHAHQNVEDPTKSGFFLHDGILDLTAINRRSFKNKGLAFLSACQTARGDERIPDEAVHLASGMLMAGYSSVIATMWSVVDEDAPFVADKVYGELSIEGKLGSGEAGKALHNAVAGLRERVGVKQFGRWVPYIHVGS